MNNITKQQILDKISDLKFNDGTKLGDIISSIVIKTQNIGFAIDIHGIDQSEAEAIRLKAINKLKEIPNVNKITITLTSSREATQEHAKSRAKHYIDGVKKVILVSSGKGGVGKSTIASLIAQQLNLEGHKVGIVDADIYGPSIPHIFGINTMPDIVDNKMIPLVSQNIQIISIGFLIKDHSAIIWRGPMASKTIYQLLSLTKWDNLDYLIIDMPPGTGDIHISILENYHLNGVILVTTKQKIVQAELRRSIDLYKKFNIPILGIIENMSYLVDSASGAKLDIFGETGVEYLAKEYNIPLLYKVPIIPELSQSCDNGTSLAQVIHLPTKGIL